MFDLTLHALAFLGPIGMPEMIVLGILGVLIFGKRLPEVGKSLGKGIVEFKKGLQGIDEDVEKTVQGSKQLEDPMARATSTDTHIATDAQREPAPNPPSA
jgi:sec-independent protein translocase protein TatA